MERPTERFSKTIDYYDRFRPQYPVEVIETLQTKYDLSSEKVIADIGSGTGIFTKQLLATGCRVYGIEPNREMRDNAERILAPFERFKSIAAPAEQTPLSAHSIDYITAAQAFHWFKHDKAKQEFIRILKPKGWLVLVWNLRNSEVSDFMKGYEAILVEFGLDYLRVSAESVKETEIINFYKPEHVNIHYFKNYQVCDWEHYLGRVLSTSYIPRENHPHYQPMMAAVKALFDSYQQDGKVTFVYDTKMYVGHLI